MIFLISTLVLGGGFIVATALSCQTDEEIVFTVRFTGLLIIAAVVAFLSFGALSVAADALGIITLRVAGH